MDRGQSFYMAAAVCRRGRAANTDSASGGRVLGRYRIRQVRRRRSDYLPELWSKDPGAVSRAHVYPRSMAAAELL
jgi:hypothetical protein